jgi:two-component system, NtrC family, sensor kinase
MNTRPLRIGAVLVVLGALAAGWGYLFVNSHAVDAERQNAVFDRIRELSRIDAEWSADVLRADADIIRTYDPLTKPIPNITRLIGELEAEATRLADTDIKRAIEALWGTVDSKTALIDHFKSSNSLLKNSLRYSPTASGEIQTLMRAQRDAGWSESSKLARDVPAAFDGLEKAIQQAGGAGEGLQDGSVAKAMAALRASVARNRRADSAARGAISTANLESDVATLISNTLAFSAAPELASREALLAQAEQLRGAAADQSPAVREAVHNVLLHVDAISRLRGAQRNLLADISRLPVATNLDALGTAFGRRFEAEQREQAGYNRILLWYSAGALLLVFGAVALVAWRVVTEGRRLRALVQQQTRELRENEAQLAHAHKMSVLGETVAGIAHEINTPLATVKSGLQSSRELLDSVRDCLGASREVQALLATPMPQDEVARAARERQLAARLQQLAELHQELDSMAALASLDELGTQGVRSIDHIHQVVVNMLDFSRIDRARVATIHIEEAVEHTLQMAGYLLKDMQVVKSYQPTQPVTIDVAQINQVVLNLVKNAAQAMPPERGELRIDTLMADAGHVMLRIADNGSGIPRELLKEIWEPFFTTRKSGAGTGLGLSTSKRIVAAHQGRIEVESTPNQGTTFTIVLPAASAQALLPQPAMQRLRAVGA